MTLTHMQKATLVEQARVATEALLVTSGVLAAIPDDDPEPESPVQPTDLRARLYAEGTGLTLELVWTGTDNVGKLPTTFEVARDDDPSDGRDQFVLLDSTAVTAWEQKFVAQADVPYAYRVRGRKEVAGTTYYSSWSNVADPEPFVLEPPPSSGRTSVKPGFDFSGKTGKYLLEPGEYPTFEFESKLDLYCAGGRATFKLRSGQQWLHRGATDVVLDGVEVLGGGKGEKLNDQQAFGPGDRWTLRNFRVADALGVGVGCDGRDIRISHGVCEDCGSAGLGGKASASIIHDVVCRRNNVRVRDRDGAIFGKWTRTEGQLFIGCVAEDGTNAGNWHDINNCNVAYFGFVVRNVRLADPSRVWTACGFKEEISENRSKAADTIVALCREAGLLDNGFTEQELRTYNYNYRDCEVTGTASYPVDWNETQWVYWRGGLIEESSNPKEGGSIGLRDLPRADAKAKGQDKNWVLGHILVEGVKAVTGTLTFWGSASGNKLSMAKYDIKYLGVVGNVKLRGITA